MLWSAFFRYKDMEIDDIIWTNNVCYKEENVNGKNIFLYKGTINLYRDGKIETVGDILLSNFSKNGENLLVGMQNLYPDTEGFKGIITYDIATRELNEILAYDKICDFLGEENHELLGKIQMTMDGKLFYFACGKKIILYDAEKSTLDLLFETQTSCNEYFLNAKETCLYYSDSPHTLYKYDILTKKQDSLIDQDVYNFAVSKDEKLVVYENRRDKALFLYYMDTGEKRKLVDLNYGYSAVYISEDSRYILYTDYREAIVPTNCKIIIYVKELETGKRRTIYKGTYQDNIGNVLW